MCVYICVCFPNKEYMGMQKRLETDACNNKLIEQSYTYTTVLSPYGGM